MTNDGEGPQEAGLATLQLTSEEQAWLNAYREVLEKNIPGSLKVCSKT